LGFLGFGPPNPVSGRNVSLRPKEEIVERQQTLAIIAARFRQGNGSNSALSRDHFLKRFFAPVRAVKDR